MTNQLEEELSPEIITLLQSDNDGIHFMFKPNTLLGGMERDGNPTYFGADLTLPCGISQLAEWLLFQRNLLESNSWEGRNAMLNWLNGIMHSKPLAGAIKKAGVAKKEAEQRENQSLVEAPLSEEEYAEQRMEKILGFNSIPNECDYWAGKPTLVADDAIPLMNGLDPKSWRNRANRHLERENPLPDDMVIAITRGLKIAEADGSIAKSPTEWLAWGRRHGLDKPTMKSNPRLREFDICMWQLFAQAVAEVERKGKIKLISPLAPTNHEADEGGSHNDDEPAKITWQQLAQEAADRIYKRDRRIGCDPSIPDIAKDIEKEFADVVFSVKGKRLNADYIKRHGLEGWKRPEI